MDLTLVNKLFKISHMNMLSLRLLALLSLIFLIVLVFTQGLSLGQTQSLQRRDLYLILCKAKIKFIKLKYIL